MKNDVKVDKEIAELLYKGMLNMREFLLNKEPHIKKYKHYRKLHSDVLNSMISYIENGHYNLSQQLDCVTDDLLKEVNGDADKLKISLDLSDYNEYRIYMEHQIYKNHDNMKSITEEYLEKNKFKNKEKVDMLIAMNNSFISFFKIVNKEYEGYVTIIDLITNKEYKIIDISLSNPVYKSNIILYARLIEIDDISFLISLCSFPNNIKVLNNYIKKLKYKKKSNFIKTLEVYHFNKEYGFKFVTNNII